MFTCFFVIYTREARSSSVQNLLPIDRTKGHRPDG